MLLKASPVLQATVAHAEMTVEIAVQALLVPAVVTVAVQVVVVAMVPQHQHPHQQPRLNLPFLLN